MPSPKRDQYKAGSGKLLKNDDTELDVTAILTKLDTVLSAVSGLKVNADINVGDIEIGAVELKDGATDTRAVISTADADASDNSANRLQITSALKAFNGTTWDRIRSGITAVTSTFTGFLNNLPWSVYHTSAPTRTNGQGGPLESDSLGNLQINLNTNIRGENEGTNTMNVWPKPPSELSNAVSTDRSAGLEASTVAKASSGRLHGARVRVDSTLGTGPYYIQFINASSLPPNGSVTFIDTPQKVDHVNGVSDNLQFDWSSLGGLPASTGIVMAISTTEYTLTLGTAHTSSAIYYA